MSASECPGDSIPCSIVASPIGVAQEYLKRGRSYAPTACVVLGSLSLSIRVPKTRWNVATGTSIQLRDGQRYFAGTVSDADFFFVSTFRGPGGARRLDCRIIKLFESEDGLEKEEAGSWTALEGGNLPGVEARAPQRPDSPLQLTIDRVVGEPARSLIGGQTVALLETSGSSDITVTVPKAEWGTRRADVPDGADFYVGYLAPEEMFLGFLYGAVGARSFECYIVSKSSIPVSYWTATETRTPA